MGLGQSRRGTDGALPGVAEFQDRRTSHHALDQGPARTGNRNKAGAERRVVTFAVRGAYGCIPGQPSGHQGTTSYFGGSGREPQGRKKWNLLPIADVREVTRSRPGGQVENSAFYPKWRNPMRRTIWAALFLVCAPAFVTIAAAPAAPAPGPPLSQQAAPPPPLALHSR